MLAKVINTVRLEYVYLNIKNILIFHKITLTFNSNTNNMHFQKKYYDFLVKMFILKNKLEGWFFRWVFWAGFFIANHEAKP
jgi:hypothetical protein